MLRRRLSSLASVVFWRAGVGAEGVADFVAVQQLEEGLVDGDAVDGARQEVGDDAELGGDAQVGHEAQAAVVAVFPPGAGGGEGVADAVGFEGLYGF